MSAITYIPRDTTGNLYFVNHGTSDLQTLSDQSVVGLSAESKTIALTESVHLLTDAFLTQETYWLKSDTSMRLTSATFLPIHQSIFAAIVAEDLPFGQHTFPEHLVLALRSSEVFFSLIQPTFKPPLFIFAGGMGAGKTYLLNRVVEQLRDDDIELPVVDPDDFRSSSAHSPADHERALQTCQQIRTFLFKYKIPFAITTTNRVRSYTDAIIAHARDSGFEVKIIHVAVEHLTPVLHRLSQREERGRDIYAPEFHSSHRRCASHVNSYDDEIVECTKVFGCGRSTPNVDTLTRYFIPFLAHPEVHG
jgi:predicted ABC-type ATPase